MLIYPQLSTGVLCQYPIRRKRSYRTITNSIENGSRIALRDVNATQVHWQLEHAGISDTEAITLAGFFEAVEGRLTAFTFLDPVGNLLAWSEDITKAAWQRNSLLQGQAGVTDPYGSQRATRLLNSGGGDLALVQTIGVPGSVSCCWSLYARSDPATTITLTGGSAQVNVVTGPDWRRFTLSAGSTGTGSSSDFGVTIPAAAAIDLFGLQVEAQPSPSKYVQTLNESGVYPATHFDSDSLDLTASAPNANSCVVRLVTHTG